MGYGGRWRKRYIVCPLEAFVDVALHFKSKKVAGKINKRITVTEDVHPVPGTRPWFPLIDKSHYANRTLCGITSEARGESIEGDAGPIQENPLMRLSHWQLM